MRYHLLVVSSFFYLLSNQLVAQAQPADPESPFSFEASYVGDGFRNFSGGIQKGGTYLGMANIGVTFNMEKAGFWKGGQFYINGSNTHGGRPSETYTGDFQIVSNIEAGNLTYVHELWYRQCFGKFSSIIGVQDLNAEFASSVNSSLFLNSSFGVHSTIANNIPSPIFPLTALGWLFQYDFTGQLSGKVAIFDGLPEGYKHNTPNLSWTLDPNEGYLLVSEWAMSPFLPESLTGIFKLGAYYHNHYGRNNPADALESLSHENYGVYMVADQTFFENDDGKKLSAFAQLAWSPSSKNTNFNYWGFGLNYQGLIIARSNDILGLALARAGFRSGVFSSETTIELTYKVQLTEQLYFQPDLQYIIHPAGTDVHLNNALSGIARFSFNF